jgi:hypothetical protein
MALPISRLTAAELDSLATNLHGPRWGLELSRDLHLDPRLLRRWKAGTRAVSCCYSTEIAVLVHDRRVSQARFERVRFNAMADGISALDLKAILLAPIIDG